MPRNKGQLSMLRSGCWLLHGRPHIKSGERRSDLSPSLYRLGKGATGRLRRRRAQIKRLRLRARAERREKDAVEVV